MYAGRGMPRCGSGIQSAYAREDRRDGTERPTIRLASKPRPLDLREAAAYLGVSCWTIRDWVLDGLLPVVRLPGGWIRARDGTILRRSR